MPCQGKKSKKRIRKGDTKPRPRKIVFGAAVFMKKRGMDQSDFMRVSKSAVERVRLSLFKGFSA